MDHELGAYVLHALDAAETDVVQRHLAGCPDCRDEVRKLADTAALLALLTPQDIEELYHHETVDATAARIPPRQRHRRVALALASAALVASAGVGAVRVLTADHGPSSPGVVHVVDRTTHAQAALTMTDRNWGTQLHLSLAGTYPSGSCSLVAHSRDGASDTAATWVADAHGSADVNGTTAISAGRLSELDVLTDSGELLVRIPLSHHDN